MGLPDFSTTQVCPEKLSEPSDTQGTAAGAPPSWFARVVFDKLLDPSVEDLIAEVDSSMMPTGLMFGSLAKTQPVTLKCNGVDVPYDGYYVPNGNSVSWPLGPALFVQPISAVSVPVGAMCEIAIKPMVHNKAGESVPEDQRSYNFQIASMALRFSNPDPRDDAGKIVLDGKTALAPKTKVKFYWKAAFTAPPDPTEITITEGPNVGGGADPAVCGSTGGTPVVSTDIVAAANGVGAATTSLVMDLSVKVPAPNGSLAWKPSTTYRVEFASTAKMTPKQGGTAGTFTLPPPSGTTPETPVPYKLCFHTTAM